MEGKDGTFMLKVRRCKRCGRLLMSKEAVERGYGCQCAQKARREEEEKQPIPGQMNLSDFWEDGDEKT